MAMDLKTIAIILLAVIAVAAEIRAELYHRSFVIMTENLIHLYREVLEPLLTEMTEITETLSTPATPEEEQK